MVHGEKAHSRYFSETAYSKLNGDNKELLIIPGANHTDLYDQMDIIPFEKLNAFFAEYLFHGCLSFGIFRNDSEEVTFQPPLEFRLRGW